MFRVLIALGAVVVASVAVQSQSITAEGLARTASLFNSLRGVCPQFYPLDAGRVREMEEAAVSTGKTFIGEAKFGAALKAEYLRRSKEVEITGRSQWCQYQKANQQSLGFGNMFSEPKSGEGSPGVPNRTEATKNVSNMQLQKSGLAQCFIEIDGKIYLDATCHVDYFERPGFQQDGSFSVGTGSPPSKYFAYVNMDGSKAVGSWNAGGSKAHATLGEMTKKDNCWINESEAGQSIPVGTNKSYIIPHARICISQTVTASSPLSNTNSSPVADWHALLSARLERGKLYPTEARARKETGVATLSFTVDRQGNVGNVSITKSSGSAILDKETLLLAVRLSPLPAPPAEVTGALIPISVPVRYGSTERGTEQVQTSAPRLYIPPANSPERAAILYAVRSALQLPQVKFNVVFLSVVRKGDKALAAVDVIDAAGRTPVDAVYLLENINSKWKALYSMGGGGGTSKCEQEDDVVGKMKAKAFEYAAPNALFPTRFWSPQRMGSRPSDCEAGVVAQY
jgi:TonB family protein